LPSIRQIVSLHARFDGVILHRAKVDDNRDLGFIDRSNAPALARWRRTACWLPTSNGRSAAANPASGRACLDP